MLKDDIRADVAKATVTLVRKEGQGVLVDNYLIVTASHCIDCSCEGEMALGTLSSEIIRAGSKELMVTPLAVEPIADIAVLGSPDEQNFAQEADDFAEFCENTKPVAICQSQFDLFREVRVYIYTHHGNWVTGKAKQYTSDGRELFIETDEPIVGGTSGGPIVNEAGELVGIVSSFKDVAGPQDQCNGFNPRLILALPVWVANQIFNGKPLVRDYEP